MITRLLIANRGEIARRIMATCRTLGIETVAVHSDADANGAFVHDADMAVSLGGNTPAESYLRTDAILEAAALTGADAIHPGYGFLSENAAFAQSVIDAGLIFVGPTPDAIAAMGSKLEAKARMEAAGVPLLPSADLTGMSEADVAAAAADIGFPILIKASAGGGGRGMRVVNEPSELVEAVTGAQREAESAFGDGTVYAERYVSPSRHVEVQIFGDQHGNVVHFHERECSIQRRHQKIIEEAPSPSLDDETRAALHDAAVKAGQAIGYQNAGTVEFLLGGTGAESEFFFLEVNTRLQVEHPVTEAILDTDLVALQLSVASGGSVPNQSDIGLPQGHAMEARLYAEDPTQDYQPSTGTVHSLRVPNSDPGGAIRLDTAIVDDGEVSQYYDPMIAKVISHGPTRRAAAGQLAAALAGSTIDGITTNRDLLVATLRHPEFLGSTDDGTDNAGDSDFLVRHDPAVLGGPSIDGAVVARHAAAAALAIQAANRAADRKTPSVSSGFRNVPTSPRTVLLQLDDQKFEVAYRLVRGRVTELAVNGEPLRDSVAFTLSPEVIDLSAGGLRQRFDVRDHGNLVSATTSTASVCFSRPPTFVEPGEQVEAGSTVATMPGTIVEVKAAVGDVVEPGDVLLVMEAMKMELSIAASAPGVVTAIPVNAGDTVEAGAVLAVVGEPEAD